MFREGSDLVRQAANLRLLSAERLIRRMSGYGICCESLRIRQLSFSTQSGQSGYERRYAGVLSPLNKAMTFQIDTQVLH
jgi:hypothetical protein